MHTTHPHLWQCYTEHRSRFQGLCQTIGWSFMPPAVLSSPRREMFPVIQHETLLLSVQCHVRHTQPFLWAPNSWNQSERTPNKSMPTPQQASLSEGWLGHVQTRSDTRRDKWSECRPSKGTTMWFRCVFNVVWVRSTTISDYDVYWIFARCKFCLLCT